MNKTQNYQLNQWEAGDKVQRTDFNADNAKIDAALKTQADGLAAEVTARTQAVSAEASARSSAVAALENKTALHTIKTLRVKTAASGFQIPMDDINWSSWRIVATILNITASYDCQIFPDGTPGTSTSYPVGVGNKTVILQFPLYRGGLPFSGVALGNSPGAFNCGGSFDTAQGFRLYLSDSNTIQVGSSVTILGMK